MNSEQILDKFIHSALTPHKTGISSETRKSWLSLLAKADRSQLQNLWQSIGAPDGFTVLRAPQVGLTMVRGRAGASGEAFNLGEMTLTRCSLRLALSDGSSVEGHGYCAGRDLEKVRVVAACDALLQTEAADLIEAQILVPLAASAQAKSRETEEKAAATQVKFFTMVRGE
ncbi:MAG: phosphonate C-P lyase system protein PhnG [Neomegalonema sp.]|nr:phosphonate C-P lyase system protein PhnG [Neomegalonema sp.]